MRRLDSLVNRFYYMGSICRIGQRAVHIVGGSPVVAMIYYNSFFPAVIFRCDKVNASHNSNLIRTGTKIHELSYISSVGD